MASPADFEPLVQKAAAAGAEPRARELVGQILTAYRTGGTFGPFKAIPYIEELNRLAGLPPLQIVKTNSLLSGVGGVVSSVASAVTDVVKVVAEVAVAPALIMSGAVLVSEDARETVKDAGETVAKAGLAPIVAVGGGVFAEDLANETGLYSKEEAKLLGTAGDVAVAGAAAATLVAVAAPIVAAAPAVTAPTVAAPTVAAAALPTAIKEAPGLLEKVLGKKTDEDPKPNIVAAPAPEAAVWPGLALVGALASFLVVMVWRA